MEMKRSAIYCPDGTQELQVTIHDLSGCSVVLNRRYKWYHEDQVLREIAT